MSKYATTIVLLILAVGIFVAAQMWGPQDDGPSLTVSPSVPSLMENTPTPRPSSASKTPSTSPRPTVSSTPSGGTIHYDVAFTAQAPLGEWSDERQQDGCEEASSLMAMYWVRGIASITPEKARQEILAIVAWEEATYGNSRDTSAQDTADGILKGYYKHSNVRVESGVSINDIIEALRGGNVVIVPVNGQLLGNPYFTPPGPERHKLLIVGYDPATKQFITNDPGTRRGKNYRYSQNVLYSAMIDYPTSINNQSQPIVGAKKSMIVVGK